MSVKWTVTIDCAQPATLAAFWKLALGYVDVPPPEGFATWAECFDAAGLPPEEWNDAAYIQDPGGVRPSISFLKVPEGTETVSRTGATASRHMPQSPGRPRARVHDHRRCSCG